MDDPASPPIDPSWWQDVLPRLHGFVRRRLRPELAALESPSDIVQSACRELLADLQREARSSSATAVLRWTFLRRALRKIVQKHRYHAAARRAPGRRIGGRAVEALLDSAGDASRHLEAAERAAQLARAMQRLPEHYQRVIDWVHFEGHPHREVARRLGRSEDACKMLLSRAMARLAQELARG